MAKKIYDYPNNILKEIFMMALTYRVSLRNLCLMFNCTIEDLSIAISRMDADIDKTMDKLDAITKNESKELSDYSFNKAIAYWEKSKSIKKKIKNSQTPEEKGKLKIELKKHQSLIDDRAINKIIRNKPVNFTREEKDEIARFRVKYSLTIREAGKIVNRDKNRIMKYCNNLALRDPIYYEQLEILNAFYEKSYGDYLRTISIENSKRNR